MDNKEEFNPDISFKIGMIAPSGVGKTSLLTAICDEVQNRVANEPLQFWPHGTLTSDAMKKAKAVFNTVINSQDNLFSVPQFAPTSSLAEYTYAVTIPPSSEGGKSMDIGFSIVDYPGGWLGDGGRFQEVSSHLAQSVALLVPISSDILMDWQNTANLNDSINQQRNMTANMMLDVDNVLLAIKNWISEKVRNKQHVQLFFVPVKCEKYFDDNGGHYDMHSKLQDAIYERYIKNLDMDIDARRLVQTNIFYIDTYGIVELREISTKMEGNQMKLIPTFQRRINLEKKLKTKNAYELLMNILKFQVDNLLETQQRTRTVADDGLNSTNANINVLTAAIEGINIDIDTRPGTYNLGQKIWFFFAEDKVLTDMKKKKKQLEAQAQANQEAKRKLEELLKETNQKCSSLEDAINLLISLINKMPNRQHMVCMY